MNTSPTLSSPTEMSQQDLEAAQNLIYSDKPLSPKMISSLLHVGVSLHSTYAHEVQEEKQGLTSVLYAGIVVIVSLILASLIGFVFLYTNQIGPFYASEAASQF